MEDVLILGGGIGGLASALAMARAGHPVTLVERDLTPPVSSPAEAFEFERRGAPQSHQTHGFLARVMVLLRDRFPDVLEALLAQGCTTMTGMAALGDPQPGDEDLKVLIVRRTTFEWVLRQAVAAEPGVTLRTGVAVRGLTSSRSVDGIPLVDGAITEDGEQLSAGLVIAATGRRGAVPGWLRPLGVEVPEKIHESGLMYLSQWYRLADSESVIIDPKLGGDLGFVKYLAVPGDGSTLSITLAVRADDKELRDALRDRRRFEAACRALPGPDRFFGGAPLEPLGEVRPMTGLLNRIRRFTDADGRPTVLGFHAVGDAHTCTNPLYGRGCSLAVLQAVSLADAAAAHPGDPAARARAYEDLNVREVKPWWQVSVQMDKVGADVAAGGSAATESDAAKGVAAVFVASTSDPVIGRGLARFWNLLVTPADLMADSDFVARVFDVASRPGDFPAPPTGGPSRSELLDSLAAVGAA
ncbi:MAG TPA: FAD-dependent oxidoreductase [Acidimicrobiales bacterium]|nr:FAD-dependent oxidoreductase [Acidimicrobiales bacterium]